MSTLAHVFEAAGLSTIVLASMKEVAERIAPPRTLYCEFPLGRPLGHPGDAEFQTDVITRSLALLEATEPIFETHPTVIESDETPMACAISSPLRPRSPTGRRRGTGFPRCVRPGCGQAGRHLGWSGARR